MDCRGPAFLGVGASVDQCFCGSVLGFRAGGAEERAENIGEGVPVRPLAGEGRRPAEVSSYVRRFRPATVLHELVT